MSHPDSEAIDKSSSNAVHSISLHGMLPFKLLFFHFTILFATLCLESVSEAPFSCGRGMSVGIPKNCEKC